ncbi:MAG TPA: glycosyl hydrolase 115 family protein [Verrucomicrobiae bacterium]|nr:glycosyl hydrolase 115 family protein [Verrucomicrobiae bacterium]
MRKLVYLLLLGLFTLPRESFALGEVRYVENSPSRGSFALVGPDTAAILADTNDWPGVIRAAHDLQADIARVTGRTPAVLNDPSAAGKSVVIVGTIGKGGLIDRLIREKKIEAPEITGKWESYFLQVVAHPLPGVENALVICGSDKRGTIYGIYELSEEIGVSPWYFWEDVPAHHADALYVKAGKYIQGPPAVKYRGIFLNDEAPDLTGWAKEKFGGYNHTFYTNVFELLLRLKANYLWPAMWDNCFSEDDPVNPQLADEYGIVMGTSHVEPMMRADKEWNRAGYAANQWNFDKFPDELTAFWKDGIERNKPYENIITMAMRGKIDTPMSESNNIALLEKIVVAQRKLIADVFQTNVAAVPQLWALYKEVQGYYEDGMRVPDDVTLLWCDDNWGNVRRLPTAEERHRSGGAGIYYHLDYVGGPRNYKWVNSVPITKIWDQMNLAFQYGADRIWIVNVGHLQHVAYPTEFFLSMAWNPAVWPKERLSNFTRQWAAREFGPDHAAQIADIVAKYTKYNGRRKPELLAPDTFSLLNYQEAVRVLGDWMKLTAEAGEISEQLPANEHDSFFEQVLYPIKACAIVNELYFDAALNHLYATQGRASANVYANAVRALFKADADLASNYEHEIAGGKWVHMMDQTHIGYTSWQQPNRNIMPAVREIEVPTNADMGVAVEGSASVWPGSSEEPVLPTFDVFNQSQHYIDVFNRDATPYKFSAAASAPWIQVYPSPDGDPVAPEQRLWVNIDWAKAPAGSTYGWVKIPGPGTNAVTVKVNSFNPPQPQRDSFDGFVESGGVVSIEAEHFTKNVAANDIRWETIPDYGRTLSSMSVFPVTASSVMPPENSPHLEYKMYLFSTGQVEVTSIIAPTLNFVPGRGLRFAVSFDDEPPQIVTAVPKGFFVDNGVRDWEQSVRDNCREIKSTHTIEKPGEHTLKIWMVDPAVALQKIVVNTGGLKPSYLGPPESFHGPVKLSSRE